MARSLLEGMVKRIGALRLSQGAIHSLYVIQIGSEKPVCFTVDHQNSTGLALVKVGDTVQLELVGNYGDQWELVSMNVSGLGSTADIQRNLLQPW